MEKALECPICLDILKNPYCTLCQHNFCYRCLLSCFSYSSRIPCPCCRTPIKLEDCRKNITVSNILETLQNSSPVPFQQAPANTTQTPNKRPTAFGFILVGVMVYFAGLYIESLKLKFLLLAMYLHYYLPKYLSTPHYNVFKYFFSMVLLYVIFELQHFRLNYEDFVQLQTPVETFLNQTGWNSVWEIIQHSFTVIPNWLRQPQPLPSSLSITSLCFVILHDGFFLYLYGTLHNLIELCCFSYVDINIRRWYFVFVRGYYYSFHFEFSFQSILIHIVFYIWIIVLLRQVVNDLVLVWFNSKTTVEVLQPSVSTRNESTSMDQLEQLTAPQLRQVIRVLCDIYQRKKAVEQQQREIFANQLEQLQNQQ